MKMYNDLQAEAIQKQQTVYNNIEKYRYNGYINIYIILVFFYVERFVGTNAAYLIVLLLMRSCHIGPSLSLFFYLR